VPASSPSSSSRQSSRRASREIRSAGVRSTRTTSREPRRTGSNREFANPFWLYRLTEVQPEQGDFLCKNRGGSNAITFENIAAGQLSHVDIVTSVTDAQLLATGGNRGGSGLTVVEAAVARTNGFVDAGSVAAGRYFAILRVRTNPLEGVTLP
jgi:hypothetical protein